MYLLADGEWVQVQMVLHHFYLQHTGIWRAQCQVPRLHCFVCIQKFVFFIVIIHLASNNNYCYFFVVFLCGGLRNKIILAMARHTHLCSCRLWVAWPPTRTETKCADSLQRLSFWYLLTSVIIHYYTLQILLLSVSYKYSILNKVAVCHVEGVEK